VINSWTGTNFTEVWVQGTVTPESRAQVTIPSGTWEISQADSNADNKNLAFVIPPGLKIYGGFTGTENVKPVNPNPRLTVLSGALDDGTSAHHVVILADIPDDQQTVLDGLTITGGAGASNRDSVTVKGYPINNQNGAGLYLVNASPVLRNVRITDNRSTAKEVGSEEVAGGGGIYNLAVGGGTSSPRLTGVEIYGNQVIGDGGGGGMYNEARGGGSVCAPELNGVTIEMNQATTNGGGLYNTTTADSGGDIGACAPTIRGQSKILTNSAANGGGVYNAGASAPAFTGVEIRNNTAGTSGGGVYNVGWTRPVFTDVIIERNSAGNGGGIYNGSYYLVMTGADISRNYVRTSGGGIFNASAGAVLTNVTFEGNETSNPGAGQANGAGGALYMDISATLFGAGYLRDVVIITNGIIRGNKTAGSGAGIFCQYRNNSPEAISGYTQYDDMILHLALTNVLIAENEAYYAGGAIVPYNLTSNGTEKPGKGISVVMNNVTITGNTAKANASGWEGGGIHFNGTNVNTTSFMRVTANNSIIWGNSTNHTDKSVSDIRGGAPSRLYLNHSLVSDSAPATAYTLGTGSATMPFGAGSSDIFNSGYQFTGSYSGASYPAGSNPLYYPPYPPANAANAEAQADALLAGPVAGNPTDTSASDPALKDESDNPVDTQRYTTFRQLVIDHAVPRLTAPQRLGWTDWQ
jgi:hypothetical protein